MMIAKRKHLKKDNSKQEESKTNKPKKGKEDNYGKETTEKGTVLNRNNLKKDNSEKNQRKMVIPERKGQLCKETIEKGQFRKGNH